MKYLLDTNICIYIMNECPASVIQRCKQCTPGEIAISSITLSELHYGIAKSAQRQKNELRLEEFLLPFALLAYDCDAASAYGDIRFQVERQGKPIGALDLLIAAHAISQDLVLVTNNEKEFKHLKNLKLENWAP